MSEFKPPRGSTTLPFEHSGSAQASVSAQLAILWLHPERTSSYLREGHVIGREDCDTNLRPVGVSRRHAEVVFADGAFALRDLESRNGLYINGTKVTQQTLRPGDIVRMGEAVGLVLLRTSSRDDFELREIRPGYYGGHKLHDALADARRAAPQARSIIVQGESGTGKESAARVIHESSGRPRYVILNCAAIPENLAESELFGHTKGAFTGADSDKPGQIRAAHGGTLFLDEILTLTLAVQAKLLRTLNNGEVSPLGASRPTKVDLHLVVGAQSPLEQAVAQGKFREDLYRRLEGITVVLPPLRERKEDILPLFLRLLMVGRKEAPPALEPKLVEALLRHDWRGNVRQLDTFVQRTRALFATEHTLTRAILTPEIRDSLHNSQVSDVVGAPSQDKPSFAQASAVARKQKASNESEEAFQEVLQALRQTAGNRSRAGQLVEGGRAYVQRIIRLHKERFIAEGVAVKDDLKATGEES